jgi:hypothetical protein
MALGLVSHQPKYVHRISINSLQLAEIYFPFGGVSHLILSIFRIQVQQVMSPCCYQRVASYILSTKA